MHISCPALIRRADIAMLEDDILAVMQTDVVAFGSIIGDLPQPKQRIIYQVEVTSAYHRI